MALSNASGGGRGSSIASNSDASLVDTSGVKFSKKERAPGTIKLKRPAPKQTKPGNWRESEVVSRDAKKNNAGSPSGNGAPSPIVNELDDKDVATFATSQPLVDDPDYVVCKHCKKPIIKTVAATHIKSCLKQKQEKARRRKEAKEAAARDKEAKEKGEDVDTKDGTPNGKAGEDGDGVEKVRVSKKATVNGTAKDAEDGTKKAKKRKADGDAEKAPKSKKKKEEPKPKVQKPKGPVDVERQCGVPLPNGAQCARSLTCKSHSMGAKRAVPGRSLPYDMLLSAYQKKNQAKQQKAAIDANAPLQDDFENGAGPVDSDEERDAVMAAITRSRPQPLERRILVPTLQKYSYLRMKDLVSSALVGNRGGGLFSTGDSSGRAHGPFGGGGGGGGGDGIGTGNMFASPMNTTPIEPSMQMDGHSRRPSLIQQALAAQSR
ncbi:MAG: hypothetical protein M1837_004992 [Sclerophora amabilis]|nr:MAG: hypothetical protein M1837_004992 [Sclerophora amabilis]